MDYVGLNPAIFHIKLFRKFGMKNKVNELSLMKPIINWVIYILLIVCFLVSFLYVKNNSEIQSADKLIILLLSVGFFLASFKVDNGTQYLESWYKLFLRKKLLIENLSSLPSVFLWLWVIIIILSNGKLSIIILLNVAFASFLFPMIFGLLLLILKSKKRKRRK